MSSDMVVVHGDDELNRALDEVADRLDDYVRDMERESAELAAREAQSAARGRGGVAAKSAPAVGVDDRALVIDSDAYPFALGAEFGANQYPQFDAYLGPDGGYFAYPTVDDTEDRVADIHEDGIDRLLNEAGLR